MKKLLPLVTLGLFSISGLFTPAFAVVANNPFNVTANLTAQCLVNTAAAALDFGTYVAFGSSSVAAPTTAVSFKCTKGTVLTGVTFDATNGSAAGAGVVQGLAYTMTVSAPVTVAGTAATTVAGAGADVSTYTVTGAMAAGQPGAGAGAGTSARTLILSY